MRIACLLFFFLIISKRMLYGQTSENIWIHDTRDVNLSPNTFSSNSPNAYKVRFDFKLTSVIGSPGSGSYSTLFTIPQWPDNSGGKMHQIAFNNGGAFFRQAWPSESNWEGWRKILIENEDGKIGIGTIPQSSAKLHVNGGQVLETSGTNGATRSLTILQAGGQQINYGAYYGQWRSTLQIQGNNSGYLLHIAPPDADYAYSIFRSTSCGFKFSVGGTISNSGDDALIITQDGSVGLGISNPSEKLSVNGNVKAKKVIVSQTGWPDYVFDTSYSLRPLAEVETYIKKNKRLPEVPSAAEVEKKGISVGDNQALLLKKIEELTLYLIEIKNENAALKKRIDKLENK